jgi:ribosomal protein S27E
MHEGCSGSFENGKQTVDKVRMMGFSNQYMPMPLNVVCVGCNETFEMSTYEAKCTNCGTIHGVTPCHAFDPSNVKAAGKDY